MKAACCSEFAFCLINFTALLYAINLGTAAFSDAYGTRQLIHIYIRQ